MAIKVDAKFDVRLDISRLLSVVSKASLDATEQGLQLIERQAKILSPYEFGTNRRSIGHEVKATSSGPKGSVFTESGYGGYLEVGTGQRRSATEQKLNLKGTGGPTRFMFPAFEMVRDAIVAGFKNLV